VRDLPAGVAVVGCERLPGTHPPETSLWDVADRHADALRAAVPEGTIVLAGWSVGGVLAHAVAGRLLATGRQVAGVALLDSLAIRTPGDRAGVRSGGARLLALAGGVRRDGPGVLSDPEVEALLGQYGMDVTLLGQAPMPEVAEMLADWARLLGLLAAHEPVPVAVPARLFACADNPGDLPQRIIASWSGLCADLVVHRVPGEHLTILRPPALASVSTNLVHGHVMEAAGRDCSAARLVRTRWRAGTATQDPARR
jgi:thioesterase domain-containing protein